MPDEAFHASIQQDYYILHLQYKMQCNAQLGGVWLITLVVQWCSVCMYVPLHMHPPSSDLQARDFECGTLRLIP